ncbi:hypothetical protein EB836_12010 [Brevibacterium sp. S111]|nr:hypothetical protein EB836_12010 [Brevibacterium sp. S111]
MSIELTSTLRRRPESRLSSPAVRTGCLRNGAGTRTVGAQRAAAQVRSESITDRPKLHGQSYSTTSS